MKVNIANATVSSSGPGTSVSNADTLAQMFTASQLNRLAEKYLNKKFNKVGAKKMAESMWPALVLACGKVEKVAGVGRGGKMYTVLHPGTNLDTGSFPPQCAQFIEMFRKEVPAAGNEKQFTKAQLLDLFTANGFKTKGNPWSIFNFYRRELIAQGVMK